MNYSQIKINPDLPIADYEEEIISKFETSSNMIIIGETGSGKTTQIPLMLLKSLSKIQDVKHGRIAVTEPRRLAATSVAHYLATDALHEELGQSIGYKIRFNDLTSQDSVLIFVTDGIMLREAQLDPLLSKYSVIMVDEAHERNINSDFLIGLLIDIQKHRRQRGLIPLKIIVTSATLEKEKFENFFNAISGEPLGVVEVPGRLYPIVTTFADRPVFDYQRAAASKVEEICENAKDKKGDILIFMPGKREIEKTKEEIQVLLNYETLNLEIISVHANLTIEQQNEIFKETTKRKVVIATNIAETSLTVPGIVYVIDSGLIKQMDFNPHSGMNSLTTHYHSKKGLEQRKGRAGRIEPGFYYPLFTEKSYRERKEFQIPEILRTSLSQVVLIMKKIGIHDIDTFKFIDEPDYRIITNAIKDLQRYGALDKEENLTPKGHTMADLPIEPRLSNLILEADKNRCVESICIIASFLELKPVIMHITFEDMFKKMVEEEVLEKLANQKRQEPNEFSNSQFANVPMQTNHNTEGTIGKLANSHIESEALLDPSMYLSAEEWDRLENQAAKAHKAYQGTIKQFEHPFSDFFTMLEIYKKWEKADMRTEWAQHNYLSADTLDEATNIREELLDIVQKSGYDTTDKLGKDLYERIEKTLMTAFKYNTLIKQNNGLYKRARSNDMGIRLHNSSVLITTKPDYVISYEVIEISEIDAEPKLSAKFIHTLNEQFIRQYFPDVMRRQKRKDRFEKKNRRFKFRGDRNNRGRR